MLVVNPILSDLINTSTILEDEMSVSDRDLLKTEIHPWLDSVRNELFLGFKDDYEVRYLVQAYLTALMAVPELYNDLEFKNEIYDLTDFSPKTAVIEGANLIASRESNPSIARHTAEWPPLLEWTVHYSKEDQVNIIYGGRNYILKAKSYQDILSVDWPEELGFRGNLKLHAGWNPSTLIKVKDTPVNFPYKELVNAIKHDSYLVELLSFSDMNGKFVSAQEDWEKVAIIVYSLISATRKLKTLIV